MYSKILFVDDDANMLKAFHRALRNRFELETAISGQEALEKMAANGPYAVIVSDMRMPGMDGLEFLTRAKKEAPLSIRIMLTANSDQKTAIDAVNKGDVFRFLTKPWDAESLTGVLNASLTQYRLVMAEKELLDKTLKGSIQVLTDVLSLVDPLTFGRTSQIKKYAVQIAYAMGIVNEWWLEPLLMLSQIGCVILPDGVVKKISEGADLLPAEAKLYQQHPEVGADLLAKIPRLEEIARAIRYQEKDYDGNGVPADDVRGNAIPLGARLLKIVSDFVQAETTRLTPRQCMEKVKQHASRYDPEMVAVFDRLIGAGAPAAVRPIKVGELCTGMFFAEDVVSTNGMLLMKKGLEATTTVCLRLFHMNQAGNVREPLYVYEE